MFSDALILCLTNRIKIPEVTFTLCLCSQSGPEFRPPLLRNNSLRESDQPLVSTTAKAKHDIPLTSGTHCYLPLRAHNHDIDCHFSQAERYFFNNCFVIKYFVTKRLLGISSLVDFFIFNAFIAKQL